MANILALDASTDACSVTLRREGTVSTRYALVPRKHNQLIFSMLHDVLPDGGPGAVDLELLAYAEGPGSFTGLRIAASAVQGLAYALDLPVAGVSTLACIAQGALRRGLVAPSDRALVLLDARINEVYWGFYGFAGERATPLVDDQVCAPADLPVDIAVGETSVVAMGSGLCYLDEFPEELLARINRQVPDLWPDSQDLLVLAEREQQQGKLCSAAMVQPVYLRNEIHWKKLSEQGPRG